MKKMIAMVMAACLLLLPIGALGTGIGDTVWFGRYPYYCNDSAATEPIEWVIADEKDGWWLLITAHIIDQAPAVGVYAITTNGFIIHKNAVSYHERLKSWANDFNIAAFTDQDREMMKEPAFILTEKEAAALPQSLRVCTPTPYAGNVNYWWVQQQHSSYGPKSSYYGENLLINSISNSAKYSAIDRNTGEPDHVLARPNQSVTKRGSSAYHSFTLVKRGMRPAVWVKIPENR